MTRLLIVDDNPQSLYLLQVLLSTNGFELELASNGAEALERARRAPPDMIISDILMPVMDGFALCRACKQDERLKDIPFIFYTATYTDPKDEEFALSLGAERFIVKPLEPDKFLALLREIIETHAAGKLVAPREPIIEEAEYYKQYSAALIRKLENKVLQLEEANRALELDIAERKRAEEALSAERTLLRTIIDILPALVYVKDTACRKILSNRVDLEYMGASTEAEALGKTDFDYYPGDMAAIFYAHDQVVLQTGQPLIDYETSIVTAAGRQCWLLTSKVPLRDSTGQVIGLVGVSRDITERKQTEERLVKSLERLDLATRAAHLGIWDWDIQKNELTWDDRMYDLYGIKREDFKGAYEAWLAGVHPDDREQSDEISKQARLGSKEYDTEFRIVWPEGTIRVLKAYGQVVWDSDGNAIRMTGVNYDITESRQAEEALRESEEKYRRLVEQSLIGIGLSRGNQVIFANPALLRIFGYDDLEFARTPLLDHVAPASRDQIAARLRKAAQGEFQQADFEYDILCKDGKTKSLSAVTTHITLGGEVYTQTVFQDITDRKQAQEALRESEEKYRNVVERANDGIAVVQDSIVQFANWRLAEMWGGSVEEVTGTRFTDYIDPDELPKVAERYRRRMAGEGLTPTYETVLRRKNGEKVYVELNAGIIMYQGKSADLVIIRDITERKRAEEELIRLSNAVRMSTDSIVIGDLEGRIIDVNEATLKMYGADSKEDLIGKSSFDLIAPEDRDRAFAGMAEVLEKGYAASREYRVVIKNGIRIPVEMSAAILRDEAGNPIGSVGISRDVTERKRAEAEIQRHVRHLATLHEIDQALTSTLDLDQVLSTLLEQVQRATDAEAASVALVEAGTGTLVFRRAVGKASRDVIGLRLEAGQGIAGWAALYQQSVLAPDVVADPRFYAEVDHRTGFTTREVVCVPLRIRNAVTGVIELINKRQGKYGEDEVQLLESVAAQAAVAMENARLFEAERAGRQRLEMLYRIGQAINSTLDAEAILDRLTDEAIRATRATHGSALVALPDLGHFERRSLRGYSPEQAEKACSIPLPLNRGVNGRAYQTQRIAYLSDVRTDPDYFSLIPETRSELAVPILRGGQMLGNLDLQSPEVDAFRGVDLGFLQALTDQVAIALENARLFETERRRLEELSIISDVALAGAAGLPWDETVARATDSLARLWPDARVSFLFVDEADQSLRLHPSARGVSLEIIAGLRIPLNQGITGWVARERQPVRVGDVTADPRYVIGMPGALSEMAAPLVSGERVIGVVNIESPRLNAFSGDDLRLLTTLAGQLATLFEKARLDAALEEERASLARRVEERTAELNIANAGLRQAARAKDEFLASMSHELRTPLNAILGLSEALQEQVFGSLNEKQLRYLRTIEESGQHLLALINDILDLSKVEAGKVELQIGPVVVGSVCQASLQFIKQTALKKQIKISSTLDSQVMTLQADERRLKQILVNLLGNAVKFTPEGGSVGLDVLGDVEGQRVHFVVWDTGIGIAPENIGRLFQPFVQLDSSLSRQYSGTGLGLSLVKRLVELHEGSVSVESQMGQGSRFTVSLPWREAERQRDKETRRQVERVTGSLVSSSPSHLVLLAEDDETTLTAVSDYLSAKGCRVIVARNGHEVIQRTKEDKPDAIVMDVQMPGMDGLEAIRYIRADPTPGVATIPIIALTAMAMSGDRERCIEAGANDYVSKPVSLKELVEAIEAQLR